MIGFVASQYGPGLVGIDARWGTAGLGMATAIGGTLEFALLRRSMSARVGSLAVDRMIHAKLWAAGLAATGPTPDAENCSIIPASAAEREGASRSGLWLKRELLMRRSLTRPSSRTSLLFSSISRGPLRGE